MIQRAPRQSETCLDDGKMPKRCSDIWKLTSRGISSLTSISCSLVVSLYFYLRVSAHARHTAETYFYII